MPRFDGRGIEVEDTLPAGDRLGEAGLAHEGEARLRLEVGVRGFGLGALENLVGDDFGPGKVEGGGVPLAHRPA